MAKSSVFFTGEPTRYGVLLSREKYKSRADTMQRLLEELGIRKVVSSSKPCTKEDLFFAVPTLVITPVLSNLKKTHDNFSSFTTGGVKCMVVPPYDLINANCKRIKHGELIVMDYYQELNLIISYFNIFPPKPTVRDFAAIMSLVRKLLGEVDTFDNSRIMERLHLEKNALAFAKALNDAYRGSFDKVEQLNSMIQKKSQEIIVHYHDIRLQQKYQESVHSLLQNFGEKFLDNVNVIRGLPFIHSVKISQEGVLLDFGEITIHHKGKEYLIGSFEGLIMPTGVRFKNVNNLTKIKYMHPHINPQGYPCLGSFSGDINKLLANLEFKKLAVILYQFLKTYSQESPFANINNWKEVKKDESKR